MTSPAQATVSYTDSEQALADEVRDQCLASLAFFFRCAWKCIEPTDAFLSGWHIDAIADHLEAAHNLELRYLSINMPPGHGKSSFVSVLWPAWCWLDQPGLKWMCGSYDMTLSARDNEACRDLINTRWYQGVFRPDWGWTKTQNVKIFYKNTAKGHRQAVATQGKGTGFRCHRTIIDDCHNRHKATRASIRDGIDWVSKTLTTRTNKPKEEVVVNVGQRIMHGDISDHLKDDPDYVHLVLPAEHKTTMVCETPIFKDPRKESGQLLFTGLYDAEDIAKKRRKMGEREFEAQYNQNPSLDDGGVFRQEWFERKGFFYAERKPLKWFDEVLWSWDCAFKGDDSSDPVVGELWGRKGDDYYLIEEVRDRWDFVNTQAAFMRSHQFTPTVSTWLVEDSANGPAIISSLKTVIPGLIAVSTRGESKIGRARAISPLYEAGQVHYPSADIAPWIGEHIAELLRFPYGEHDDRVDSASQALYRLRHARVRINVGVIGGNRAVVRG